MKRLLPALMLPALWVGILNADMIGGTIGSLSGSGGGGAGYAVQPATVSFNLAQGVTGTTFTFTGPSQSTITYGVSVGSLTLTGTGNATIIENGLTGQAVISTGTPTVGQCGVWASSTSMVGQACSSGSGSVNSATAGNLAYYTAGTTISGSTGVIVTASSVTFISSAVISDTGRGSTNPGQLDLFQQNLSVDWLTMGSTNGGQRQVVFTDQSAAILSKGVKPGDLRIGNAGTAGQIDDNSGAGGTSQLINLESGSNTDMAFQTCATCGNFIFKPGGTSEVVISSFGAIVSTGTTFTSSTTIVDKLASDSYETSFSTSSFYHVAISTSGHYLTGGSTPTVSSCGTTPNGSVVGNDKDGLITIGGGSVTACTLTFSKTYGTGCIVACTISDSLTTTTPDVTTTPTVMTLGFSASIGGGTVAYHCVGVTASCL